MATRESRAVVRGSSRRRRRSISEDPPNMSDLRIVLLGKSVSENSEVGNFILGRSAFDSEAPPGVAERIGGRLKNRHVMIINSPQLLQTHLSLRQIIKTARECVSLSDPGPHVIVLLLKHDQCSAEDQECVEKVLDSFSERVYQHTMVFTTQEPTQTNDILQKIIQKCCNRHFSLQGNGSPDDLLQAFEDIVQMNDGRHLDCAEASQCFSSKQQDRERLSEGEKLNLVVCGSDGTLKSSISELILQQTDRRSDVDLYGRVISVVELPALNHLSEEEVMRQTLRCVSLCDPGVHVFLLIIPDAPLTDEDKAEMAEIQRIFSSRIDKHMMILIMQNSEHQTEELDEETQSVIERFGGRHHFFGPSTRVSTLMENIEQMLEEIRGEVFTTETFWEAQMKKLMKYKSLETTFQLKGSRENKDDLRIVLLGKTGVGKSAAGNTILGRNAFTAETSHRSVTKESQRETSDINGRHVTVIDTPGLFNTELTNEEIQREIRHCISMILPGPHVFIFVLNLGQRVTGEEATSVKIIQETFGEKSLMFTMVLFTRGDDLKDKTIEQCLGKPASPLMNLIEACGNRYHVFNNNQPGDRTQVSDLLEKIDHMVNANGGSFYSCKMFREMEREQQEQQMKILMDSVRETEELVDKLEKEKERMKKMMEEERQNHDKERKRREELEREQEEHQREIRDEMRRERETFKHEIEETRREKEKIKTEKDQLQMEIDRLMNRVTNDRQDHETERKKREEEFNEREEQYKREIIEKEESEEKMCEEMKREREEWEKQKLEEKKRREEEDEKRREKEQRVVDEFNKKVKEEREKMEREKEDLQSKHEEEENKFREREERYKKQIKEREEKENEMLEQMKLERLQWTKQTQDLTQKIEEEKKKEKQKSEQHKKQSPVLDHTKSAEDEADDQKCLRIVLIGKTGIGKSATGNTILGRKEFHSQSSTDSVMTVCEKRLGEVDGRSVAVVDTPGLFDTTLTNDQVTEEIMKCVSLSSPGPHVFIIVVTVGRFTKEETETVDLIKKIFGPKSAQFSIVLFTKGDDLEDESIQDYVKRSKSEELQKLIRDCGNRFLAFNNREKQDKTQVTRLLNMIEEVKNTNEGRYFTNSMFEEAEMSIKKRMEEIMKEREREMENQREELQTKYEMDMKIMMKRLEEEKQRADEERKKMENQFREKEEKLRKEFEEKEKTEQKKRSEEEKQRKAEYHQREEEMKREIENQRLPYEKQQREREEEDRKREEKYRQDQEKMKNEQERIIAELQMKEEEEIKKRDLEEKKRNIEEEKERQGWETKIKEAENDRKETQEEIKRQQREWEDQKKRQMREREEEERKRKEKHEEQLREKREEQEKMRERFERERKEERQKIEEEREKERREREEKERENEENRQETIKHYEQQEKLRKEEWERRRREDDERREEERKRWVELIEDMIRVQKEDIKKRETERKEREEKERDEMKKEYENKIKIMKKKHEDEARKQAEETNDLKWIKEELQQKLEEHQKQREILEKLFQLMGLQKGVIRRTTEFFKGEHKVEDLHRRLQDMKRDELKKLQEEVEKLWEEANKSKCVIM